MEQPVSTSYAVGDLELDFDDYEARRRGVRVKLTALEWRLLHYLVDHRGEIVSRKQLLCDVWGLPATVQTRAPDIAIHKLRHKIEEDASHPLHLITIYGKGYQLTNVHFKASPALRKAARSPSLLGTRITS